MRGWCTCARSSSGCGKSGVLRSWRCTHARDAPPASAAPRSRPHTARHRRRAPRRDGATTDVRRADDDATRRDATELWTRAARPERHRPHLAIQDTQLNSNTNKHRHSRIPCETRDSRESALSHVECSDTWRVVSHSLSTPTVHRDAAMAHRHSTAAGGRAVNAGQPAPRRPWPPHSQRRPPSLCCPTRPGRAAGS